MNKKIIILIVSLCVFCAKTYSQDHSLGLRGAYTIGMANYEPAKHTVMDFNNYAFGLTYTYTGFEKYYGALQTEITYAQRGMSYELIKNSDSVYIRKIRAIEVPILWRPYYTFSKDNGIIYGLLGPYVYYDISSDWEYKDKADSESSFNRKGKWEYDSLRDNRFGVGVIAGLGFGWNVAKRLRLMIEARYTFGFTNVLKPAGVYQGNPVLSGTSQLNMSVNIVYSFKNK